MLKHQASKAAPCRIRRSAHARLSGNAGYTLVELMVGLAIGLLVIGVAGGALMASRSISGTVSDASNVQQQASYAMRLIGQQLREAGSAYLNPDTNQGAEPDLETITATAPVGFELSTATFHPKTDLIGGIDEPGSGEYKIRMASRNYKELLFKPPAGGTGPQSQIRDCVGTSPDGVIENKLVLDTASHELKCAGATGSAQPVIGNVADFQVRYVLQHNSLNPTIQYVSAAAVGADNWHRVQAVEVCLVLYGDENINVPDGSNFSGCPDPTDGTVAQLDMTDASALPGTPPNRLYLRFVNVFQLRSQGLS